MVVGGTGMWGKGTKFQVGGINSGDTLHDLVTTVINNVYFNIIKRGFKFFSPQRNDLIFEAMHMLISLICSFHNTRVCWNSDCTTHTQLLKNKT